MTVQPTFVEQADDGSWCVVFTGEHSIIGQGDTEAEALEDLQKGIDVLVEYLIDTGQPVPAHFMPQQPERNA